MNTLTIKISKEDITNYLDDIEIENIVRQEIKRRLKEYYEDNIKKLVDNYLYGVLTNKVNEILESDYLLQDEFKEKVKNRLLSVSDFEVFYKSSDYGSPVDSEAVKLINETFKNPDNKVEFENLLKDKFRENIEGFNQEDFITSMGYNFMDFIRDMAEIKKTN